MSEFPKKKPAWASRLPAWAWPALLTLAAALGLLGLCPCAEHTPPVDGAPTPARSFGWVADPAAVARVEAELPERSFAQTPAYAEAENDEPGDVFLWEASRRTRGTLPPARDQGPVGACVAFGTVAAVECLQDVQIARARRDGLPAPEYRDLSPEVVYAGSRVEVGGGRVRGDGSTGAWAARWVREFGVVPQGVHGSFDLSRYSPARCRAWGDAGVPDLLERLARRHPVQTVIPVRNWEECRRAVASGYPVIVCSTQGFSRRRDAQGFARPEGVWPHCMALLGTRADRPGGFLLNSWGPDFHTGPRGAGDPSAAGFWADAAVLDRMLRQGDSWAFSDAVGFPRRALDWLA